VFAHLHHLSLDDWARDPRNALGVLVGPALVDPVWELILHRVMVHLLEKAGHHLRFLHIVHDHAVEVVLQNLDAATTLLFL
jgi:hypothetical protein